MWLDDYNALNTAQRTDFRRITNGLLSHTYLLRNIYSDQDKMMAVNNDYRIASRQFEILQSYFQLSGWDLYRDDDYGVIYLRNAFNSNRVRFDRFTTLFLYVLRLIYEEKREQVELHHDVRTDTNEVVQKMIALGLLPGNKKPPVKEREEAQKTLSRYQIISKIDGAWNKDGNKLLIYPSILFILPNSEIHAMAAQIEELGKQASLQEPEQPEPEQPAPEPDEEDVS